MSALEWLVGGTLFVLLLIALRLPILLGSHPYPNLPLVDRDSQAALIHQLVRLQAEVQALAADKRRLEIEVAALSGRSPSADQRELRARALRQAIVERLSIEELRVIVSDIGVDLDDLGGDTLEGRAQQLIAFLQRRDRLGDLERMLRQHRPEIRL